MDWTDAARLDLTQERDAHIDRWLRSEIIIWWKGLQDAARVELPVSSPVGRSGAAAATAA